MQTTTEIRIRFEKVPNEKFKMYLVIPHEITIGTVTQGTIEKLKSDETIVLGTSYWGGTSLEFRLNRMITERLIEFIKDEMNLEETGFPLT